MSNRESNFQRAENPSRVGDTATQPRRLPPKLGATGRARMQPLAKPPNHDGLDMSELPPVHQAELSKEELAALFADVGQCATNIEIIGQRNAPGQLDINALLQSLLEKLLRGEVEKTQIRYAWRSIRWIDTIQRDANRFRLVRIGHSGGLL